MSRRKKNVTPVTKVETKKETEVEVTTKDALKALGRNTKKTAGKGWSKIKYAVIGVGSAAAGAAAGSYIANRYALKQPEIELRLKTLDNNNNVTSDTITIDPNDTTE